MRLQYVDNLRVALTALVILHHTAITYGAAGSWYYKEVTGISVTAIILTLFAAVNQAFFMGLFFFIAGYFTPAALGRKGAGRFLADRLLRLGIPLLVYALGIGPVFVYLLAGGGQPFGPFYARAVPAWGPMWFVAALLYFSVGYTIWARWRPAPAGARPFPTDGRILAVILGTGAGAFLIRLAVPAGQSVLGLQLGYFSSYIVMFVLGTLAYQRGWLDQITEATARRWLRVSLLAIPVLPVASLLGGALEGGLDRINGGMNLLALIYAFWEPFVACGICMWLLVWFRRRLHTAAPLALAAGRGAYTAYIIHPPVVVGLSMLLVPVALPAMLKFALVGAAGVAACFWLAHGIVRLPGARQIL